MCGGVDTGGELLPMAERYKNKKNGQAYIRLANGIDATNSRDGLPVIVYCPKDNGNSIFVRDEKEFYEKFEVVEGE